MEAVKSEQAACCIVCGGTSDDVVLRDNGYEGRACACGTIYTSPTPPPGAIDLTEVDHAEAFYDLPAMLKARWVRRHTKGQSLLEIGCGDGIFLKGARDLGFRVEGVEPSPPRAVEAERRTGAIVHRVLLENFVAGARRYDVVYHCDLLAHFPDPRGALNKMASVLTPEGVLAFEVGLVGGIPRFWYRYLRAGYPEHLWLYSEASLRRLLAQCGLRIRTATRFDLSLCVATHEMLHTAATLRRAVTGARRGAPEVAGTVGRIGPPPKPGRAQAAYLRLQNFLRYRVGAALPRLGPGSLLVVAERM